MEEVVNRPKRRGQGQRDWWIVDPVTGWRVWAHRSREHPPYIPGQYEREVERMIERVEPPTVTPAPPKERVGGEREIAQVQADTARIVSRGTGELRRLT